jgi:formiminotetrahydrofolate cyclodeaminase
MAGLAHQQLAALLDEFGSASPAPGGGSAAALTCALGAALVEMAARIELSRGDGAHLAEGELDRMVELRRHALVLAEAELSAYAPVLDARRLPASDPVRPGRIAEALDQASRGPLDIAETAAEVAELGERIAGAAEPAVRGDALTGVVLAEAAAASAAALVRVNLSDRPTTAAAERARGAASRGASARRRVT